MVRYMKAPDAEAKLLGIWDYKALPWSVGDPLVFIEDLNVLRVKNDLKGIDICVVYDKDDPQPTNRKHVFTTTDTVQSFMLDYLPLFGLCPKVENVFLFGNRADLYSFMKSNKEKYLIYPAISAHLGEAFNYIGGADFENIMAFHRQHGYIPNLEVGQREKDWASEFFREHLPKGKVPIVISLKNTAHSTDRNADFSIWEKFLDYCKKEFPEIMFVQVGLRGEANPSILARDNVLFSKDYGTTMFQDLILVASGIMHMGPISGIDTIALFSDMPYIITNIPEKDYRLLNMQMASCRFPFAKENQIIIPQTRPPTSEELFDLFSSLYQQLNATSWLRSHYTSNLFREHPSASVLEAN